MKNHKKRVIVACIAVILALSGGELVARLLLGLGTPPLTITHPRIEYMFRPDQDVSRFGNRILINHYGMRTEPFSRHAPDEFRIMVFGDSVINGGNLTDHTRLATTIVHDELAERTSGKVVVGNISAGSWGPGNWLAYAQEYGFFNALIVVLVISSHDSADNPTFGALDEQTHPTRRPLSALIEGLTRYLPRYLPQQSSTDGVHTPDESGRSTDKEIGKDEAQGLENLKNFLFAAKQGARYVLVLQHWEKEEIEKEEAQPGNRHIRDLCLSMGISPIQLAPYFSRSLQSGSNPYRDTIHPNDVGQRLIATAILENLPK